MFDTPEYPQPRYTVSRMMSFLDSMKTDGTYTGRDVLADRFLDDLKRVPYWFKSCVFGLDILSIALQTSVPSYLDNQQKAIVLGY